MIPKSGHRFSEKIMLHQKGTFRGSAPTGLSANPAGTIPPIDRGGNGAVGNEYQRLVNGAL